MWQCRGHFSFFEMNANLSWNSNRAITGINSNSHWTKIVDITIFHGCISEKRWSEESGVGSNYNFFLCHK